MSKQKKLTREQVEDLIVKKIEEIRDICMNFDSRCHHVSMYYIGRSIYVHCTDDNNPNIVILDRHNGLFDSDPIEGEDA